MLIRVFVGSKLLRDRGIGSFLIVLLIRSGSHHCANALACEWERVKHTDMFVVSGETMKQLFAARLCHCSLFNLKITVIRPM